MPLTRPLNPADRASIDDVLRRLREHFHQWRDNYGPEVHALIGFAFYEGCGGSSCCGQILAEAAPIALGDQLTRHHGFKWIMVRARNTDPWHFGVIHDPPKRSSREPVPNQPPEPIDLESLELSPRLTEPREPDETVEPGENTHDSYEAIVRAIGQKPRSQ